MSHHPEIQALLDKQAITEVIHQYLRGADRADAELIGQCYHPDAWEDHGGIYDGPADAYVAVMAKMLPRSGVMNHLATNILIELDGEKAKVEHYIFAFARMKKKDGEELDTFTLARAIDQFEKRDGAWKIARRTLVWEWNHDSASAENWGAGMITPDPSKLVRAAKKPHDALYKVGA